MRSPPSDQGMLPLAPPQAPVAPARRAGGLRFSVRPSATSRAQLRRYAADGAYVLLAATGFSTMTLLAVPGCLALLFLLISHGQFDMFVAQLNNLTTRYVAADTARQEGFRQLVLAVGAGLALLIFALRLPGFVRSLKRELSRKDRP